MKQTYKHRMKLYLALILILSAFFVIDNARAQETLKTLQDQLNTATLTVLQLQAQRDLLDSQVSQYILKYAADRGAAQDQIDTLNQQRQAIVEKIKVMQNAKAPAPDTD